MPPQKTARLSLSSLKAPDDLVDARDFRAAGPCLFFGGGGLALLLIFIVEAGCEFFELLVKEGAAGVELLQCFVVEVDFAHFSNVFKRRHVSLFWRFFFIKASKRQTGAFARDSQEIVNCRRIADCGMLTDIALGNYELACG